MKTGTVVAIVGIVVAGVVVYAIYQRKNSQLTIGRQGLTGQINITQAAGVLGQLWSTVSNSFSGGHASGDGGYGDYQTSYMDSAGGVYDSGTGSTDDLGNYDV